MQCRHHEVRELIFLARLLLAQNLSVNVEQLLYATGYRLVGRYKQWSLYPPTHKRAQR